MNENTPMLQKDKNKQVERNDNLDSLWFLVLVSRLMSLHYNLELLVFPLQRASFET